MLLAKCSKLEILDKETTMRTRVDVIKNDRLISSLGLRIIYVYLLLKNLDVLAILFVDIPMLIYLFCLFRIFREQSVILVARIRPRYLPL